MSPESREKMERLAEELSRDAFPMSFHENERKSAKWISTTSFIAAYELMSARVSELEDEVQSLQYDLEQKSGEIGRAEHRGNTVDYIYDKCATYGKLFDEQRTRISSLETALKEIYKTTTNSEVEIMCREALGSKGDV